MFAIHFLASLIFVCFKVGLSWLGMHQFQADTYSERPFARWDRPTTKEQKTSPHSHQDNSHFQLFRTQHLEKHTSSHRSTED